MPEGVEVSSWHIEGSWGDRDCSEQSWWGHGRHREQFLRGPGTLKPSKGSNSTCAFSFNAANGYVCEGGCASAGAESGVDGSKKKGGAADGPEASGLTIGGVHLNTYMVIGIAGAVVVLFMIMMKSTPPTQQQQPMVPMPYNEMPGEAVAPHSPATSPPTQLPA